jgi:hypothetical protein
MFYFFSTATAFLRPAMKEAGSRLTVSANTFVHRVIFNGRRAIGIEYQTGGKGSPVKQAYARQEVVCKCDCEGVLVLFFMLALLFYLINISHATKAML